MKSWVILKYGPWSESLECLKCQFFAFYNRWFCGCVVRKSIKCPSWSFQGLIKVGAVPRLWHLLYSLSFSSLSLRESLSVMSPWLCSSIAFTELKKSVRARQQVGEENSRVTPGDTHLFLSHISQAQLRHFSFLAQTIPHMDLTKMKSFLAKKGFLWAGLWFMTTNILASSENKN